MVLAAGSDAPQQFEGVCVIDDHLVLLRVDNVEKPIGRIDGDTDRDPAVLR